MARLTHLAPPILARTLTWAFAAALLAVPVRAEAPAGADAFREEIFVSVRNLLVSVTDAQGRPVPGLSRGDFELLEDGTPVEIRYFDRFGTPPGGNAAAPGAAGGDPSPGGASRLVLYLDEGHLEAAGRSRVLDALSTFVQRDAGGWDRILVVARDRRLEIVQPLTSDRLAVLAALDRLRRSVSAEGQHEGELASSLREIQEHYLAARQLGDRGAQVQERIERIRERAAGAGGDGADAAAGASEIPFEVPIGDACGEARASMEAVARRHGEQMASRVRGAARDLSFLVGMLDGLPGRKALLYISDGLEQQPGLSLVQYLGDVCPQARTQDAGVQGPDLSAEFRQLAGYANAAEVTLYALEASGPRRSTDVGIEEPRLRVSEITQQVHESNLDGPLVLMARETGGRALLDEPDVEGALAKLARDAGSYYSIGYAPAHWGDGKYHTLEVLVKGDRYRVRHRQGYWDKPFDQLLAERVQASLLLGIEDNPLAARLEIAGAAPAPETGAYQVALRVVLDASRLTFEPAGRTDVRVMVLHRDARGDPGPVRQLFVPVIRPAPGEAPAPIQVRLQLPPGPNELVVALREEASGTTSYLRAAVELPPVGTP